MRLASFQSFASSGQVKVHNRELFKTHPEEKSVFETFLWHFFNDEKLENKLKFRDVNVNVLIKKN